MSIAKLNIFRWIQQSPIHSRRLLCALVIHWLLVLSRASTSLAQRQVQFYFILGKTLYRLESTVGYLPPLLIIFHLNQLRPQIHFMQTDPKYTLCRPSLCRWPKASSHLTTSTITSRWSRLCGALPLKRRRYEQGIKIKHIDATDVYSGNGCGHVSRTDRSSLPARRWKVWSWFGKRMRA